MPVSLLANRPAVSNRYATTVLAVDDFVAPGRKRYSLWRAPEFAARPELSLAEGTYDLYTVRQSDIGRLDYVAYRYYGDSQYWWIIALLNGVRNQFSDLTVGQVLKIPKRDVMLRILEQALSNVANSV